mmetsp:Transcript_1786/g.3618  ORF Transcript_1786/g.3618 Transcript_1786/m.3618 type:complete len:774 (-) Transcript_1786:263-2584(-)
MTSSSETTAAADRDHRHHRHLQTPNTGNIHENIATELDATNADGSPVLEYIAPTLSPTTSQPTGSPTPRPTMDKRPHTLRGIAWYDRNANGLRDSMVPSVDPRSQDVEWSHGVGGVEVLLRECDPATGGELINTDNSLNAMTRTQGFNNKMEPQIGSVNDGNGMYNLVIPQTGNIGGDRYFFLEVSVPNNFLLTDGICNDDVGGRWACDLSKAIAAAADEETSDAEAGAEAESVPAPELRRGRSLRAAATAATAAAPSIRALQPDDTPAAAAAGAAADAGSLGIRTGRSKTCVRVDPSGDVQEFLNFGVMKIGDTQEVNTNVALVLEFDQEGNSVVGAGRRLGDVVARSKVSTEVREDGSTGRTRYLLGEDDKAAIGSVTAEVLAVTLESRLADNQIELDGVNPKDVILAGSGRGMELAVAMEIKGHYSPPPELDFDYIVQDSINAETPKIRRGLREFNSNCRKQTNKVNEGQKEEDFNAVVSMAGAIRPGRGGARPVDGLEALDNVYSTACSTQASLPDYFETSLKEIKARKVTEVASFGSNNVVFVREEDKGGLEPWAMGPVAGIAGLIVLLVGALVFRRALGPRRIVGAADDYKDHRNRTKDVDDAETRRFGEAGGAMDDGSVDSAFYSDASDSDLEETEKERKMRRKRKEKEDEQKSNRGRKRSGKDKDRDRDRDENKKSSKRKEGRLAASQNSEMTESIESSNDDLERAREKKRAAKERTDKKASSSSSSSKDKKGGESSSSKRERRGRSKRSGGDNARAHEEAKNLV